MARTPPLAGGPDSIRIYIPILEIYRYRLFLARGSAMTTQTHQTHSQPVSKSPLGTSLDPVIYSASPHCPQLSALRKFSKMQISHTIMFHVQHLGPNSDPLGTDNASSYFTIYSPILTKARARNLHPPLWKYQILTHFRGCSGTGRHGSSMPGARAVI